MSQVSMTAPEETAVLTPEECAARASFCRLLAGVFVEEPSAAFLDALRGAESLAALAEAGVRFDADLLDPPPAELERAVACEYAALFASSGGFPPVESVRRQGGYQQAAHTEVCGFYRQHGYTVVPGRFRVFEDHLGVELQFAAALLDRMREALAAGEGVKARAVEKELKRFWALHLGRWVRGYARLIERAADHSLFREMARLLHDFAEAEMEALGLDVVDEDGGRYRAPKPEMPAAPCGGGREEGR